MKENSGGRDAGVGRERAPRHGNENVTARHQQTGPQQVKGGSPEESARGTVTASNDRLADPDRPTEEDA